MPLGTVVVRGVRRRYGGATGFEAVRGVSICVRPGEVFALLGTNGAGKTSLIELLMGLGDPAAGTITVLGFDPVADRRFVRRRTGVVLQTTGVPLDLTASEAVTMWAGMAAATMAPSAALSAVDLAHRGDVAVRQLSGGERRRLDLASAIVSEPDLLFLDEPTTGLDPESRQRTWAVIGDLVSRGATVVLTTHYLEEAEALADRLAIMHEGRVVRTGTPEQVAASNPARIRFQCPQGVTRSDLRSAVAAEDDVAIADATVTITTLSLQSTLMMLLVWARRRGVRLARLDARAASLHEAFMRIAAGDGPADQGDVQGAAVLGDVDGREVTPATTSSQRRRPRWPVVSPARVGPLAAAELRLLWRDRTAVFGAMFLPVAMVIAVSGIELDPGAIGVDAFLASSLLGFVLLVTVYYTYVTVLVARREGFVLKALRAGQLSDADVLSGVAAPVVIVAVAQAVVVVVLGAVLLRLPVPVNGPVLAVAVAAGIVLFAVLAAVSTTFTRSVETAQVSTLPVVVVCMVGSGLVVPLSTLPDDFARLLGLLPLSPVMDLIRLGWFGTAGSSAPAGFIEVLVPAARQLVVLLFWIGAGGIAVSRWFSWEPRR